jgi:hypothetical protein
VTDQTPQEGELILYRTADDAVRVEVLYESETFWLDQRRMAELFGVEVPTVSYHLKEIYASGELVPEATLRKILRVQREGNREVRREIEFYNLDAIISVGYRISSAQATQFRIWATQTLREFIVKGFVLDDERLKLNKRFGKDYFDELLERIREIRASERRFYLKITDIYEQCSIDYDPHADTTKTFFKTVQNKLHWAVTGKTAAELIAGRANSEKPSMGLTSWKNAPKGKILKSDVSVAKNYLIEHEIKELERIVSMYLDYAENQAARQIPMKMADCEARRVPAVTSVALRRVVLPHTNFGTGGQKDFGHLEGALRRLGARQAVAAVPANLGRHAAYDDDSAVAFECHRRRSRRRLAVPAHNTSHRFRSRQPGDQYSGSGS